MKRMSNKRLGFQLNEYQARMWDKDLARGPRRCGATFLLALRAVDWLLHNPNGQGIVLGMSTENTEMLQEYVHNILLSCNAKLHKVTRYNISLNGSTGRLLFPNNWAGGLCGQSPGHVFVDNFSKIDPGMAQSIHSMKAPITAYETAERLGIAQ